MSSNTETGSNPFAGMTNVDGDLIPDGDEVEVVEVEDLPDADEPDAIEREVERERDGEDEQDVDEIADAEAREAEATASQEDGLFDAAAFEREDLAIAKVDGQGIDKIAVKFAGRVMLDRSEPADVALFNSLQLGQEVELRVAGRVGGVATTYVTNKGGDLDAIIAERKIILETVWILVTREEL